MVRWPSCFCVNRARHSLGEIETKSRHITTWSCAMEVRGAMLHREWLALDKASLHDSGGGLTMALRRHASYGWFWLTLLGLGLLICGSAAWLIAAFRVVLPYDEVFAGLTLSQLNAFNPRLIPFMAHD